MTRFNSFNRLPDDVARETDAALLAGTSPRRLAHRLHAEACRISVATLYRRRAWLIERQRVLDEAALIAGLDGEAWEIAYLAVLGAVLCARYPAFAPARAADSMSITQH